MPGKLNMRLTDFVYKFVHVYGIFALLLLCLLQNISNQSKVLINKIFLVFTKINIT